MPTKAYSGEDIHEVNDLINLGQNNFDGFEFLKFPSRTV